MQYVGWLFSIAMYVKKKRKKRESTEWLDLGIHDPSTQDFSLSPLGHCLRLDVQYIVFPAQCFGASRGHRKVTALS